MYILVLHAHVLYVHVMVLQPQLHVHVHVNTCSGLLCILYIWITGPVYYYRCSGPYCSLLLEASRLSISFCSFLSSVPEYCLVSNCCRSLLDIGRGRGGRREREQWDEEERGSRESIQGGERERGEERKGAGRGGEREREGEKERSSLLICGSHIIHVIFHIQVLLSAAPLIHVWLQLACYMLPTGVYVLQSSPNGIFNSLLWLVSQSSQ